MRNEVSITTKETKCIY